MDKPYLHDISGLVRALLAFGLIVAAAAHVISRMISRQGRRGLPLQFLGLAMVGVLAVIGLVVKPELGAAFGDFVYSNLVSQVLPKSWTDPGSASEADSTRR
jgi:hypothetical protein